MLERKLAKDFAFLDEDEDEVKSKVVEQLSKKFLLKKKDDISKKPK